jgi:hypothetical protein
MAETPDLSNSQITLLLPGTNTPIRPSSTPPRVALAFSPRSRSKESSDSKKLRISTSLPHYRFTRNQMQQPSASSRRPSTVFENQTSQPPTEEAQFRLLTEEELTDFHISKEDVDSLTYTILLLNYNIEKNQPPPTATKTNSEQSSLSNDSKIRLNKLLALKKAASQNLTTAKIISLTQVLQNQPAKINADNICLSDQKQSIIKEDFCKDGARGAIEAIQYAIAYIKKIEFDTSPQGSSFNFLRTKIEKDFNCSTEYQFVCTKTRNKYFQFSNLKSIISPHPIEQNNLNILFFIEQNLLQNQIDKNYQYNFKLQKQLLLASVKDSFVVLLEQQKQTNSQAYQNLLKEKIKLFASFSSFSENEINPSNFSFEDLERIKIQNELAGLTSNAPEKFLENIKNTAPFITYTGSVLTGLTKDQRKEIKKLDEALRKNLTNEVVNFSLGVGEGKSLLINLVTAVYSSKETEINPGQDLVIDNLKLGYKLEDGDKTKFNLQNSDVIVHNLSLSKLAGIPISNAEELINKAFSEIKVSSSANKHLVMVDELFQLDSKLAGLIYQKQIDTNCITLTVSATPILDILRTELQLLKDSSLQQLKSKKEKEEDIILKKDLNEKIKKLEDKKEDFLKNLEENFKIEEENEEINKQEKNFVLGKFNPDKFNEHITKDIKKRTNNNIPQNVQILLPDIPPQLTGQVVENIRKALFEKGFTHVIYKNKGQIVVEKLEKETGVITHGDVTKQFDFNTINSEFRIAMVSTSINSIGDDNKKYSLESVTQQLIYSDGMLSADELQQLLARKRKKENQHIPFEKRGSEPPCKRTWRLRNFDELKKEGEKDFNFEFIKEKTEILGNKKGRIISIQYFATKIYDLLRQKHNSNQSRGTQTDTELTLENVTNEVINYCDGKAHTTGDREGFIKKLKTKFLGTSIKLEKGESNNLEVYTTAIMNVFKLVNSKSTDTRKDLFHKTELEKNNGNKEITNLIILLEDIKDFDNIITKLKNLYHSDPTEIKADDKTKNIKEYKKAVEKADSLNDQIISIKSQLSTKNLVTTGDLNELIENIYNTYKETEANIGTYETEYHMTLLKNWLRNNSVQNLQKAENQEDLDSPRNTFTSYFNNLPEDENPLTFDEETQQLSVDDTRLNSLFPGKKNSELRSKISKIADAFNNAQKAIDNAKSEKEKEKERKEAERKKQEKEAGEVIKVWKNFNNTLTADTTRFLNTAESSLTTIPKDKSGNKSNGKSNNNSNSNSSGNADSDIQNQTLTLQEEIGKLREKLKKTQERKIPALEEVSDSKGDNNDKNPESEQKTLAEEIQNLETKNAELQKLKPQAQDLAEQTQGLKDAAQKLELNERIAKFASQIKELENIVKEGLTKEQKEKLKEQLETAQSDLKTTTKQLEILTINNDGALLALAAAQSDLKTAQSNLSAYNGITAYQANQNQTDLDKANQANQQLTTENEELNKRPDVTEEQYNQLQEQLAAFTGTNFDAETLQQNQSIIEAVLADNNLNTAEI